MTWTNPNEPLEPEVWNQIWPFYHMSGREESESDNSDCPDESVFALNDIWPEFMNSWWRRVTSAWAAPGLFAPKIDGKLRFCVDYRALNRQTIRTFFPILLTDVLIDRTQIFQIFSPINLCNLCHQIRIYEPNILKTAFVSPFGHFEYLLFHLDCLILRLPFKLWGICDRTPSFCVRLP